MWESFEQKIETISVYSVYLINISWKQYISLKYDQQNFSKSLPYDYMSDIGYDAKTNSETSI